MAVLWTTPEPRGARASAEPDDAVPRFADHTEEATPAPEPRPEAADKPDEEEEEEALPSEEKSFEDDNLGPADTTFSSTMLSETTDTKATGSPAPDLTGSWRESPGSV